MLGSTGVVIRVFSGSAGAHQTARFTSGQRRLRSEPEAKKQLAGVNALFGARASGAPLDLAYESLAGRSAPRATVKAELADWLTECEGSTSPETLELYGTIAEAFATHLGAGDNGPMLDAVTPEHIREFMTQRRAKRNASTVNLERKILAGC